MSWEVCWGGYSLLGGYPAGDILGQRFVTLTPPLPFFCNEIRLDLICDEVRAQRAEHLLRAVLATDECVHSGWGN